MQKFEGVRLEASDVMVLCMVTICVCSCVHVLCVCFNVCLLRCALRVLLIFGRNCAMRCVRRRTHFSMFWKKNFNDYLYNNSS